jgi:hypothetical protein
MPNINVSPGKQIFMTKESLERQQPGLAAGTNGLVRPEPSRLAREQFCTESAGVLADTARAPTDSIGIIPGKAE